jgi:hypothetical protein
VHVGLARAGQRGQHGVEEGGVAVGVLTIGRGGGVDEPVGGAGRLGQQRGVVHVAPDHGRAGVRHLLG